MARIVLLIPIAATLVAQEVLASGAMVATAPDVTPELVSASEYVALVTIPPFDPAIRARTDWSPVQLPITVIEEAKNLSGARPTVLLCEARELVRIGRGAHQGSCVGQATGAPLPLLVFGMMTAVKQDGISVAAVRWPYEEFHQEDYALFCLPCCIEASSNNFSLASAEEEVNAADPKAQVRARKLRRIGKCIRMIGESRTENGMRQACKEFRRVIEEIERSSVPEKEKQRGR